MHPCAVIPHYDHIDQFRRMLPRLLEHGLPLVIVDDASPDHIYRRLERLLAEQAPAAMLLRHAENQGKGGAVITGLKAAFDASFTHALQLDADGQHDVGEIPGFLELARAHPDSLVCGRPEFDESISALRFYSRYITLFFCRLASLSSEIQDALCGFRIYPLATVVPMLAECKLGKRMAFDPEILVRCVWAGIPLRYRSIRVCYPDDGRSHYHYFRDNLTVAWMHVRTVFGMVPRSPRLLRRARSRWRGAAG